MEIPASIGGLLKTADMIARGTGDIKIMRFTFAHCHVSYAM